MDEGSQRKMITEQKNIPVDIEDEMRTSYLDYAMSVIIGRALPDVRDGLILFTGASYMGCMNSDFHGTGHIKNLPGL